MKVLDIVKADNINNRETSSSVIMTSLRFTSYTFTIFSLRFSCAFRENKRLVSISFLLLYVGIVLNFVLIAHIKLKFYVTKREIMVRQYSQLLKVPNTCS